MATNAVTIELPESILTTTGQSRAEFESEARFLLLAKLFELGRISSGRAADICGLSRGEFLFAAGRLGISLVQLDEQELQSELDEA